MTTNPIAVLEYEARRARDVTLVVGHGYSSSKQNLDGLCAFLGSHGFAVYSLDFPGHKLGASGGRLRSVEDLIGAMDAVVRFARERGARRCTRWVTAWARRRRCASAGAILRSPARSRSRPATGGRRCSTRSPRAASSTCARRTSTGCRSPEVAHQWQPLLDDALPRLAGRPVLFVAARARRDGVARVGAGAVRARRASRRRSSPSRAITPSRATTAARRCCSGSTRCIRAVPRPPSRSQPR